MSRSERYVILKEETPRGSENILRRKTPEEWGISVSPLTLLIMNGPTCCPRSGVRRSTSLRGILRSSCCPAKSRSNPLPLPHTFQTAFHIHCTTSGIRLLCRLSVTATTPAVFLATTLFGWLCLQFKAGFTNMIYTIRLVSNAIHLFFDTRP